MEVHRAVGLIAAGILAAVSTGFAADLKVLSQPDPIKGELVALDRETVVFKTDKEIIKPLQDVVEIGFLPNPPPTKVAHTLVVLTDGTLLHCKPEGGFHVEGAKVQLTTLADQKIEVPLTGLSSLLKDAHNLKSRDKYDDWSAIVKARNEPKLRYKDILVRKRDDERLVHVPGVVNEGKGTVLEFVVIRDDTKPGIKNNVDLTNPVIQGFLFANKLDVNAPPPSCKLIDVNNNVVYVSQIEAKEGGDILVTTVAGAKIQYRRDLITKLDFSKGKIEYLSGLEYRIIAEPDEDRLARPRRDKNMDDGTITLAGKRYERGLAMFARTVVAFKLDGEYKVFSAVVGVDDGVGVGGNPHVRLLVEGDGKVMFNGEFRRSGCKVLVNGEFQQEKAPYQLQLNVKDVQELRLSVERASPMGVIPYGHHLDIADAKISK